MAKFQYLDVKQRQNSFILTALPAKLLVQISYAAVRRQTDEEGAVQRVLNASRISGIRDFALKASDFPASIVLNWVADDLQKDGSEIEIPEISRAAQIIDGQHRVAGLKSAMEQDAGIGEITIPVAIYEGLDTPNSARIFLSINTEQRPVPKSLVFDLYGIAETDLMDPAAIRAGDIVAHLNSKDQPYEDLIKLPNQKRQKGGIALSTAVNSIKPLVAEKGQFEQIGAHELEIQKAIFTNYFGALKAKYGRRWVDKNNAFIYAAGFIGAIEFLRGHLIDYCKGQSSFEPATIATALALDETNLILQEEVKGMGGADAANAVRDRLISAFKPVENTPKFKV